MYIKVSEIYSNAGKYLTNSGYFQKNLLKGLFTTSLTKLEHFIITVTLSW